MGNYVISIIKDLDKLDKRCYEITAEDLANTKSIDSLIHDLKDTMESNPNISALACPQIGEARRIFAMRFKDKIQIFMNPIYKSTSEEIILNREECASIPDKQYLVLRHKTVKVQYQTQDGHYNECTFDDFASGMFEQMYQLLDGITLVDMCKCGTALELEPDLVGMFNEMSDEEKEESLKVVYKILKTANEEAIAKQKKELEENPGMKEFYDKVSKDEEYMTKKLTGEITTEKITKEDVEKMDKAIAEHEASLNNKDK